MGTSPVRQPLEPEPEKHRYTTCDSLRGSHTKHSSTEGTEVQDGEIVLGKNISGRTSLGTILVCMSWCCAISLVEKYMMT